MSDESAPEAPEQPGTAEGEVPRLRLRSLKVHAFRDVRPGTELRFGDGFHLILGKNATGKSTLLELLAAVSVLNFRGDFFAETPFHLEAEFKVGKISVHAEVRRTFEPVRIKSAGDSFLEMAPRDEADVIVRVEHPEVPLRQWVRVRTGDKVYVFSGDPRGEGAEHRATITLLGGVDPLSFSTSQFVGFGATVELEGGSRVHPDAWSTYRRVVDTPGTGAPFDEATGALNVLTGGGFNVVRGEAFRSYSSWLPATLDFSARGEPVTRDLYEDPLLKTVVERLGYDGAKLYFGPGRSVSVGWAYSSPSFQFFRKGKAVRRQDQLSFGQQRLFSFAWYLACNPDVVIADELVNGLHREWIDWCVEAMRDRQCFLTSQNPILVDAVPFASEEDVRRGIILCEAIPDASGETNQLSWRQLDDREVALVGGALRQSRLDQLSDILHALDLW
jgi:energy-coupling factor transporter ATP-binding protein EcfA2